MNFLALCFNPTLQKTLRFDRVVPDRVNRSAGHRLDASGKGVNVCRVLTQLGQTCLHLTQLGGELRPLFLDLCRRDGVALEWVESRSPIRFCYTLIDEAQGSVTELVEESEPVEAQTGERLMEAFTRLLPDYGTLIISGSKAAGFSDFLVPRMVEEAKKAGKRVILDLRGQDLLNSLPYGPDLIKPNLLEFAATFAPDLLVQQNLAEDEAQQKRRIGEICGDLWKTYGSRIILTRGGKGIWFSESGGLEEYPVTPVPPVNTTGSGDAFTAGLAAALGEGASLEAAIARGAQCGALNAQCFKVGVIREP